MKIDPLVALATVLSLIALSSWWVVWALSSAPVIDTWDEDVPEWYGSQGDDADEARR